MSEKVEKLFTEIKDFPEIQRPQIRSLLVSLIASYQEADHDQVGAALSWTVNDKFLHETVDKDVDQAFSFAVSLATLLPKSENETYEWFRRYLIGNGLTILADDRLHSRLNQYLSEDENGKTLAASIQESLSVNVKGWDKEKIFSTPESFNCFASLVLGVSLNDNPAGSLAKNLAEKAESRLAEASVRKLVNCFTPLPEARRLSTKLKPYL